MTGPYGIFTQEDARRIHNAVLGGGYNQPALDIARDKTIHNSMYYVILKENLDAATNPKTGYKQAEGRVVRYTRPMSGTSLAMDEADVDTVIEITNRYKNFSAVKNDVILVARNGSEWSPVNIGSTDIEGKLDGSLAKATNYGSAPATATLSIWEKNETTGYLVDSGRNETVVNRMINAGPFASGTIVYARWMNGEWRVYAADC